MMLRNARKGFTLYELVIVLLVLFVFFLGFVGLVIGILWACGVFN